MPGCLAKSVLVKEYNVKKKQIEKQLKGFNKFNSLSDKELFEELAFCVFTPGSKAINGNKAVKKLKSKGLLFEGSKYHVAKEIKGIVRFHNNKAMYLIGARKILQKRPGFNVRGLIVKERSVDIRQWLVTNIKGIGYKEASHFLRNIGLGSNLAILDTHILKNLKRLGLIKDIPASLGRKKYLDIESRMRRFSKSARIPIDALDLLFWSRETGFIYK